MAGEKELPMFLINNINLILNQDMTIIELLNSFKDIEFQAKRMLKSKKIDLDYLTQFDLRCEEIRLQILQMDLSDEINSSFNKIGRIEVEYTPILNFGDKASNLLTFGQIGRAHV